VEDTTLIFHKNWSIKIECERYGHDSLSATYSASAIVIYVGGNAALGTNAPECFVANLPGALFYNSREAKLAVQQEAIRRIDALPILPTVLGFYHSSNPAMPLAGSDVPK
jgi:hypothetical protein